MNQIVKAVKKTRHDRTLNNLRHGESEEIFSVGSKKFLEQLPGHEFPELVKYSFGQPDPSFIEVVCFFVAINLLRPVENLQQLRFDAVRKSFQCVSKEVRHLHVTKSLIARNIDGQIGLENRQSTLRAAIC